MAGAAGQTAAHASLLPLEGQGTWHYVRFIAAWHGNVPAKDVLTETIARPLVRTPEGVRAKARALIWLHGGTDGGPIMAIGDGLFEALLADLTSTPCRFRPARVATDAEGTG